MIETIDLTLNSDSSSDTPIQVKACSKIEQHSEDSNFHIQSFSTTSDPFSVPLINISRSLIDIYSVSSVDPFSILLKHLNEINFILPSNLIYQIVSSDLTSIFPILLNILTDSNSFKITKLLTIRAISAMSYNNQSLCRTVLDNIDFLLQMGSDNVYLIDILELFRIVSVYATVKEAEKMINQFHLQLNLIHFVGDSNLMESSRSGVLSVYSEISKYGDIFPSDLVHDILNKINFMGNGIVLKEISYPSMLCIFEFLKQPNTEAYKYIESKTNILVPKLSLALESAVNQNEVELQMLALKLLYSVFNEYNSNNTHSMYFCLLSSLNLIKFYGKNKDVKYLSQLLIDIILVQK